MSEGSIQSLVLIFPGALGDFLLALPTLRVLARRTAAASKTLVVPEPLRALARMAGVAERVASLDDAAGAWLFGGSTLPWWLEGRPAVLAWLGTGHPSLRERLATVAEPVRLFAVERGPGVVHAAMSYAAAAGVPAVRQVLAADARLDAGVSPQATALCRGLGRPVLAIHRGAGAPAKRWPASGFAEIVRRWRGDVVELLGPAECGDDPLPGARPARGWSVPDVAALLARTDVYLGNDSGITHLAAAVGARGVAVFVATDPTRWGPLTATLVALPGRPHPAASAPSPDRVLAELARAESLTSSHPRSSVRA